MGAHRQVLSEELINVTGRFFRNQTIFVASRKWLFTIQTSAVRLSDAKNLFEFWDIVSIIGSNNTRQGYVFGSLVRIKNILKLAGYLFLALPNLRFSINKRRLM